MASVTFNPFTGTLDLVGTGAPGPSTNKGIYNHPGTVAVGDVVYLSAPDTVDLADANDAGKQPLVGVVASVAGLSCEVMYNGELGGFVGLSPGAVYYLSEVGTTGNTLTDVAPTLPPSIVQTVGYARSATVLVVMADQNYVELV